MNTLLSIAGKNIIIVPDIQVHHSQQSQQARKDIPQRNTADPIRFVALPFIKLNWPALSTYIKKKKQF